MNCLNTMIIGIQKSFEYPDLLCYFNSLIHDITDNYIMKNKKFVIKITKKIKFIDAFEDIYAKYKMKEEEENMLIEFAENYLDDFAINPNFIEIQNENKEVDYIIPTQNEYNDFDDIIENLDELINYNTETEEFL